MSWNDVVGHTINAAIALAAFAAWRATIRTYRGSYRPVLRPVPLREPNRDIIPVRLILKNIGRGPAVSVCLVDPNRPPLPFDLDSPIVQTADVVEPLGQPRDDAGERNRIGRVEMEIDDLGLLRRDVRYRLLYQDLTARWHETVFWYDREKTMRARYLGALGWWAVSQLPKQVREQAQIVRDTE